MIDDLRGLVAKSLVRVDVGGGEARYSLLETLRAYTLQRTQPHPEPILHCYAAGGIARVGVDTGWR